jgi:hypothetical protein
VDNIVRVFFHLFFFYFLFCDSFIAYCDGEIDASGASSSNAGNQSVPPLGQSVEDQNYEVTQEEVWKAVEASEASEERELRNSLEWKETECHIQKVEGMQTEIGRRAKEIARGKGFNPGRCEAAEDAAIYIAEDVEDIPEKEQIGFLVKFMRSLNNLNSETWERINEEIKKWRSWED